MFQIMDNVFEIVSDFSGKKRICLVVSYEENGCQCRQPFYQSTGTNGHSVEGQWIPFNGIRNRWFVKYYKNKVPPPGSKFAEISEWLSGQTIEPKFSIASGKESEINQYLGVV